MAEGRYFFLMVLNILQVRRFSNKKSPPPMSEKYKEKYRNESARLQGWDYGSDGAYFLTICTNDREHFFGEIKNGSMRVSPAGAIAHVLWYEIKNHAKHIE